MWLCQDVTGSTSCVPAKHLLQTAPALSPACKANTWLMQPGVVALALPWVLEPLWEAKSGKTPFSLLCQNSEAGRLVCRTGKVPAAFLEPLETPVPLPASAQPLAGHGSQPIPASLRSGDAPKDGDMAGSSLCQLACCSVVGKLRQSWSTGILSLLGCTASCPIQTLTPVSPCGFFFPFSSSELLARSQRMG